MKVKVANLISLMERCGSIGFEDESEREGFSKLAQDVMNPMMAQGMPMPPQPVIPGMSMMGDPAMAMPQQVMPMVDPAAVAMQGAGGPMPVDPMMAAAPGVVNPGMTAEEAMVGESITNSDIESLVKVINVLTTLKGKYDGMKKEQMDLLKAQVEGPSGDSVVPQGM